MAGATTFACLLPASGPSKAAPDAPRRPWWAPILLPADRRPRQAEPASVGGDARKGARRRAAVLTAEKARVLRREMRATQTWHDAMYHSAIASRLASPDD